MENAIAGGRPQVTIVNGSRRAVWVALYKRSPLSIGEPPVAWQVVLAPPRGKTSIYTPRDYQVCARYSFEPENPWRPVYQTNALQVSHAPTGAGFVIESVPSQDRRICGAVLARATGGPGWNQIRVVNRFLIAVWSHVRQAGRDIFPPRILQPGAALIEDLSSPFCVAVLPSPRAAGDLLPDFEIAMTETVVNVGDSVRIQGGPFRGFKISRLDPPSPNKGRETPKKQAKKVARSRRGGGASIKARKLPREPWTEGSGPSPKKGKVIHVPDQDSQ
jgi:hypothetical protein